MQDGSVKDLLQHYEGQLLPVIHSTELTIEHALSNL